MSELCCNFQMPASHTVGGVWEIRTELQRVMDRRTEVQTDKGKTICPSSFGDGGIIKQQGVGGGLFGHFYCPLSFH